MDTDMDATNDEFSDSSLGSPDPLTWPWRKRAEHVCKLVSDLRTSEQHAEAEACLKKLAKDPKWEVRMAVAENLIGLPEDLFVHLLGALLKDSNQDVKASATRVQKDLQRTKSWASDSEASETDIESMYGKMARKFGSAAAKRAREIAGQQMALLVGPVVHDIKNEIQKILGSATDMASSDNYDGTIDPRSESEKIITSARSMQRMVSALLEYSRPMKLNPAEEVLSTIIESCLADFDGRRSPMGHLIRISVDINPELKVWVDRDQIERMINNLLKNSVESFSHPKCQQPSPEIKVSGNIAEVEGRVTIRIEDNGHGMREEELNQVRKLLPIRSHKPDGTGFGLPSVGQIVFAHKGAFLMDSEHGKGTVATVTLPINSKE